jgi:hypothetical protein
VLPRKSGTGWSATSRGPACVKTVSLLVETQNAKDKVL